MSETLRATSIRWLKFNAVGGIGIVVQLTCLAVLTAVFRLNYVAATALAVEAAVIHNFFWHERFTWADRGSTSVVETLGRFARFNLTTGAFSIVGYIVFMRIFVGFAHLPVTAANLASITACSLLNFVVSDRVVFRAVRSSAPPA